MRGNSSVTRKMFKNEGLLVDEVISGAVKIEIRHTHVSGNLSWSQKKIEIKDAIAIISECPQYVLKKGQKENLEIETDSAIVNFDTFGEGNHLVMIANSITALEIEVAV